MLIGEVAWCGKCGWLELDRLKEAGLPPFAKRPLHVNAGPGIIPESDVLEMLRYRVSRSTQKKVAEEIGISQQYLCDILKERRVVPDRVGLYLGFDRVSGWKTREA